MKNIDFICKSCGAHDEDISLLVKTYDNAFILTMSCNICKSVHHTSVEGLYMGIKYHQPILISSFDDKLYHSIDNWMIGFDTELEMQQYTIYTDNIILDDSIYNIQCIFEGKFIDMPHEIAKEIAIYYKSQSCYKNYSGLLDSAWDCQTPLESLASISNKPYWKVYCITKKNDRLY